MSIETEIAETEESIRLHEAMRKSAQNEADHYGNIVLCKEAYLRTLRAWQKEHCAGEDGKPGGTQ
jgi:hypothetical protein